jgi:hypothetical protein
MTPGFRSFCCLGTTGAANASLRILLVTKLSVSLEISMRKVDARVPACGGGCGRPYIFRPPPRYFVKNKNKKIDITNSK